MELRLAIGLLVCLSPVLLAMVYYLIMRWLRSRKPKKLDRIF